MSDIEQLQGRILAALGRASRGVDKLSASKDEVPDLSKELEEERLANAQLTERVKALKDRLEAEGADHRQRLAQAEAQAAQAAAAKSQIDALDVALQQVRSANAELADACAALRDANAEGVGDADLINQSLQAELDALKAVRRSDAAEVQAILTVLTPLVASTEETA